MYFEKYYKRVIKYDLINRFYYLDLKTVPKLQIIHLSFNSNNFEIKNLAKTLLALNLVVKKKGKLFLSNKILSKLITGIDCNIYLKKKSMFNFFTKFILNIIFHLKTRKKVELSNALFLKNITINFKTQHIFKELEKNYEIFYNSAIFSMTVKANTKLTKELKYLLNSFKFLNKIR